MEKSNVLYNLTWTQRQLNAVEVKVVDIFSEMAKHEETTYRGFDGGQSLELLQKLLALVGNDKDETIDFPLPATLQPSPCCHSKSEIQVTLTFILF